MRAFLLLLLLPAFAQAQLPPIKLTVDAAPEAKPALRYELLPNASDRVARENPRARATNGTARPDE